MALFNQAQKEQFDENLEFMELVKRQNKFNHKQMATLTEYSEEAVRSWFAKEGSSKFRRVPSRAVSIAKMKLSDSGKLI
ncbi:MAG: hypothetical protein C0610_17095 [Desulfobacteraceae bacterium]|nr:MAG: hypothetical protein C0610_17095 [Desulfobacteraceae bacterium]